MITTVQRNSARKRENIFIIHLIVKSAPLINLISGVLIIENKNIQLIESLVRQKRIESKL